MPAPAPQPAENGAPRTELQELQLKAQQTTDEVFINNFNKTSYSPIDFSIRLVEIVFHIHMNCSVLHHAK